MHLIFQIGSTASKPVNPSVAAPITATPGIGAITVPSSVPGTAEPDTAPRNFFSDQTSGVSTRDMVIPSAASAVASTLNPAVRTVPGNQNLQHGKIF